MGKRDIESESFPRKFGKYHLLGPLAQGGMGALYLAVTGDAGLERLLVIKTVLPHLADEEYVARFRDEAKVVVQLSHANLIPVFDAGQVGGELFVAMDFVEGKDLRAVWNRCAKKAVAFPVDVAVYIIKELCRGLDYAHSFRDLKLVHRDVSPPNVLLSYQGEVKLTDFGLASSTLKLEKTAPGVIYGKVAYMSPEHARGDGLDGRSDLYALGIVLWELLTGRQLFPPGEEQPQDLLERARDPEVPPPSRRAPRVPPELDEIVVRALAPRRDERYASGKEFRDALAGWLAREAPATDAARLEAFVTSLFAEDLENERAERGELLERAREHAESTLPASHELRRMLEDESGDGVEGGAPGRRAEDRGHGPGDRRRKTGRRATDGPSHTARGVAVEVPRPGPGGRTFVGSGAGGAAAAEETETPLAEEEPSEVIGQVLDGRYEIQELVGEGGMGRVYLAEHVEIGRKVAVKILHPVYGRMPDLVERFRREARAATRIGHPHIVDVTDSGATDDGSVYFVMEYLEGLELANVIDREGALEISRALSIATQTCRALAAAHTARIIHRDLKPENVFLTAREGTSDFVKVLDFGIAKSTEAEEARTKRLTSPGMAMGTPEYMAPEQAAGKMADARCDVYAVGAILYEMLTGSPPYQGDNFMEILTKKATVDPAPPRELREEIPEAVQALVIQAMARNPEDRPKSMEALEYELTKCLSGRGAAVAKMLGMAADDKLVASLNPGVPVRAGMPESQPHQDGASPAGEPSAPPRRTPPGEQRAFAPEDELGWTDSEGTAVVAPPQLRRSRAGLLGWTVFGLLVAGGVGVTLYAAASETGGEPVPVAGGEAAGGGDALEPGSAGAAGARAPDAGAGGRGAEAKRERSAREPAAKPKPRARRRERAGEGGPPRTEAAAQELLREAHSYEAELKWAEARQNYQRVARGEHMRAEGLLGIAKVAFETRDTDAAITYARRALRTGAGDAARMLLGHAHFKQERYEQAIRHYDLVLEHNPANKQAQQAATEARRRLKTGR